MRRVGIVGSRPPQEPASPEDRALFAAVLDDVEAYVRALPKDAIVISGGARGVDWTAVETARLRGLEVVEHLPGPEPSPQRYHARNQKIANDSTELFAAITPWARGTWVTVRMARERGIPIELRVWGRGRLMPIVTREGH